VSATATAPAVGMSTNTISLAVFGLVTATMAIEPATTRKLPTQAIACEAVAGSAINASRAIAANSSAR